MEDKQAAKKRNTRRLLRNFLIELVIYGSLVLIYFIVVLRFLKDFLTNLFQGNLVIYAVIGLLLILAQGVLLDWVTSFLLDQIKLERLE